MKKHKVTIDNEIFTCKSKRIRKKNNQNRKVKKMQETQFKSEENNINKPPCDRVSPDLVIKAITLTADGTSSIC